MKPFKKLFITFVLSAIFAFGLNQAQAYTISDIPSGYWAEGAIIEAVANNYLPLSGGKFYPSAPVARNEFANAVYGVIKRGINSQPEGFKDVSYKTQYGDSILSLQQLRVVFGYPDGTFKPSEPMKRSEAASVIANIIKSEYWDENVLNKFQDKNEVPKWAVASYVNDIINDIYVNYPKEELLQPNEYITRAETAVLIAKLKYAVDNYKTSYLPKGKNGADEIEVAEKAVPIYLKDETLEEFKYAYDKKVNMYDTKKIIKAGNLVPVKSLQNVNSRTVAEGEFLTYVSPKDIYSLEGTKLYDAGTKFIARVEEIGKSYWFKRQEKAYIVFNKAILNNGVEFPVAGVLYSMYNEKLVPEKQKDSRKVEKDAKKQYPKQVAAYNFADKKLTPLVKYNEKGKDNLFMLITGDMIIPDGNGEL